LVVENRSQEPGTRNQKPPNPTPSASVSGATPAALRVEKHSALVTYIAGDHVTYPTSPQRQNCNLTQGGEGVCAGLAWERGRDSLYMLGTSQRPANANLHLKLIWLRLRATRNKTTEQPIRFRIPSQPKSSQAGAALLPPDSRKDWLEIHGTYVNAFRSKGAEARDPEIGSAHRTRQLLLSGRSLEPTPHKPHAKKAERCEQKSCRLGNRSGRNHVLRICRAKDHDRSTLCPGTR